MRRTAAPLLLLALLAAPAAAADLTISVEGLRNARGVVAVCVAREPAGFPGCGARSSLRRTVEAAAARRPIVFRDLAPGPAAVSVLHDEDGDGRLGTNLLGIPTEGIGVSNNRMPMFSAPRFGEAAVRLPTRDPLRIRMVYR